MARRLVILAPNWLGDAVMALPLVSDVRRAWPEASITIAARGSVAALFRMVETVDEVLELRGGGAIGALSAWQENARILASGEFDHALLLPNSFVAAWTAARAGIPERWGYRRDWRGRLLTRSAVPPRGRPHQAEYYQTLGEQLGFAPGPAFARVTAPADALAGARALLMECGVRDEDGFVAMAPGAAYGRAKQWLPNRFAELANLLAVERGVATVLVGSGADATVCATIARKAGRIGAADRGKTESRVPRVVDLAGRTDLPTLAGVLSLARAVVSNDSGAMHLASAVGAPVVAVFGSTDEHHTAPLRSTASSRTPAVVATNVWCRPCMLRECPIDHRCMRRISARTVFDALHLPTS